MTNILADRKYFKPFDYPFFSDQFILHEQHHWTPYELNMSGDVNDWNLKLTESEKYLITQILKFFTQGDIDISSGYIDIYLRVFKHPEIRMMLSTFINREAIHILAYSHLLDTLNLPTSMYSAFLEYSEMKDKHDYLFRSDFDLNEKYPYSSEFIEKLAVKLAIFSAFGEGMQLFSSFIMLLNFQRHGKMKSMGQIIQWSIVDETHHTNSMIYIFKILVSENKDKINLPLLKEEIYTAALKMVALEDKFIDLAFKMGDMEELTSDDVKAYIRYITNKRLISLGYDVLYENNTTNPLPWVEDIVNLPTHVNFFETKSIDYSVASLSGKWPWET